MQETFASVATAIDRFDYDRDGATFRGWLWTIVRNKIRDRARAQSDDRATGGSEALIALQQIAAHEDPPSDLVSDQQLAKRRTLELIRERFDPRSWKMFWETTVQGRDPADVADEMQVTRWAIYKSRARVLQRLKQEFAGLE